MMDFLKAILAKSRTTPAAASQGLHSSRKNVLIIYILHAAPGRLFMPMIRGANHLPFGVIDVFSSHP
jgi:hypothetical protein